MKKSSKSRRKRIFTRCLSLFWRVVLAIFGFCIGLGCSLLFYEFVLSEMKFDETYKAIMFLSTATFLGVGFAISKQIVVVTLLTLPGFAGRAGRRALQAGIGILLVSGPIENLGKNAEETLRFLACIKDMLWDIFMTGLDLVLGPIQHIISDIKTSASEMQSDDTYNVSAIKDAIRPVFEEIEDKEESNQIKVENDELDSTMNKTGKKRSETLEKMYAVGKNENDTQRAIKNYRKKLAYRCEEIYTKGTQACIKIFEGKLHECQEYFGSIVSWIICWPMKLDFICDFVTDFTVGNSCPVTDLIDDKFGDNYAFVKNGIEDFKQNFAFKINYLGLPRIISLDQLKSTRDAMLEQFLKSKKHVKWYLETIKRALAFTYLLVLLSAIQYHKKYFLKLSFDNVYPTKYFLLINKRRRAADKKVIFPLKSFEKGELIKVKRLLLTVPEMKTFMKRIFFQCIMAIGAVTIFALDHIYKELLTLLQNHAEIKFKQQGKLELGIQVTGKGFLAKLLRKVVKDFRVHKDIDVTHFTKPCLPNPSTTHEGFYHRVIVGFCILFANAYFEPHLLRFQHCIADYFYTNDLLASFWTSIIHKRYKKRSVWLYNEMLRRRRRKMSHLKRKVLDNAEKFRTFIPLNPLQLLAKFFPKRCACLKRWKAGRKKCLLCMANGAIRHCPQCGFSYCAECFKDMDQKCLYCLAEREQRDRQDEAIANDQPDDVV